METTTNILHSMDQIVNVRDYEDREIKEEIIDKLLTAFSYGPSLANIQPWEVIILEVEEQKEIAVQASLDPFLSKDSHGAQQWIKYAPFVMVVCLEKRRALARLGEDSEVFAIQDLFSAIQNFRLISSLNGISTSLVREFDQQQLNNNLSLPWYVIPYAIVTAGYSHAEIEMPPRFQLQDIVHRGEWK